MELTQQRHYAIYFLDDNLHDVYQFGVFDGQSMTHIAQLYKGAGIPVKNFIGFDSFRGMPEEKAEPLYQEAWAPGELNATKHMGCSSEDDCVEAVRNKVQGFLQPETELTLVKGFFCDTLKDDLVKIFNLQPAGYVDLDSDIYSSTIESLQFMLRNKLIVEGTVVYIDDYGGTPDWQTASNGASRAWKEMCELYKVNANLVYQFGNSFPHVQRIYKVISVG